MSEETSLTRMSSINRPLTQVQPYWNNSLAIRQEIQRFESVHPSIYAIYDLIESIPDPSLGQQIRDHVVCIERKKDIALTLVYLCETSHLGGSSVCETSNDPHQKPPFMNIFNLNIFPFTDGRCR